MICGRYSAFATNLVRDLLAALDEAEAKCRHAEPIGDLFTYIRSLARCEVSCGECPWSEEEHEDARKIVRALEAEARGPSREEIAVQVRRVLNEALFPDDVDAYVEDVLSSLFHEQEGEG